MIDDTRVFLRSTRPDYGSADRGPGGPAGFAELGGEARTSNALTAVRALLADAGFDAGRAATAGWNPLSDLAPAGSRILLKPNWIRHANRAVAGGLDCLVTHTDVVEAALRYAALARPRSLMLADAPVQGCVFETLMRDAGVGRMLARELGAPVTLRDLRKKWLPGGRFWDTPVATARRDEDYVLFDLGEESLLEPISRSPGGFRVTMYDPDLVEGVHGPGRHRYLIAREVLEADLVINLPKLKTHRKAGVTGALKNMVGINGLKDYLPHHRRGSVAEGGDNYEHPSRLKRFAEDLYDAGNRSERRTSRYLAARAAQVVLRLESARGRSRDLEGSWHGNDTVWRMALDLQRILHYGRPDGCLDREPQRQVLTISDGIIAGEGNGPTAPTPVPLGLVSLSRSVAASDWVHARLMGADPSRIPIVREAFSRFSHPLCSRAPGDIEVFLDGAPVPVPQLPAQRFSFPPGWKIVEGSGLGSGGR